jgi:putative membrane protein
MNYLLSVKADYRIIVSIKILLLFHFCGLIGLHTEYRNWFLSHTPLNLILATLLLLINHQKLNLKLLLVLVTLFAAGFALEVVGVKTGAVFGSYYYGNTFGTKFLGVPLVIGMNWAALCLAAATLVNQLFKSFWLKALLAAAVPVSIDLLIELVCETFDFWYWQNSQVPLQNYVAWYVCSFFFVLLLISVLGNSKNPLAPYFLLVQFVFFLILNLTHA